MGQLGEGDGNGDRPPAVEHRERHTIHQRLCKTKMMHKIKPTFSLSLVSTAVILQKNVA